MERKLRIAQYGCGKMSVYTMRYAMEKGAEIVCAFGRSPHNLGKDIGDIAGVGKTGVLVQDAKDAAAILMRLDSRQVEAVSVEIAKSESINTEEQNTIIQASDTPA